MIGGRTVRFAAWSLLATTAGFLVALVVLGVGNAAIVEGSSSGVELVWVLSWLGFALVGALLADRRPLNPVGWILLGITFMLYLTLFLSEYAVRGLVVAPGSLPLALTAGWIAKWSMVPTLGLVLALLLVFPTGRIEGRWLRRVAAGVAVLMVLLAVLLAVEPLPIRGDLEIMNPLAITAFGEALVTVVYVVGYAFAALALVIVANVLARWRRARGVERQQFRWFAYAVTVFPVLFVTAAIISDTVGATWSWDPVVVAMFVGMNGIAAAIGIAVARYRLFEIERIITRTLSYAVLTVLLVGVYAVGVVGAGSVIRGLSGGGGGDLVVAASTLAVAVLFRPLRARVQGLVDRRFNRARYNTQRLVERFAQRMRDEVDLTTLVEELGGVAATALQPRHVSVWLPGEGTYTEPGP